MVEPVTTLTILFFLGIEVVVIFEVYVFAYISVYNMTHTYIHIERGGWIDLQEKGSC